MSSSIWREVEQRAGLPRVISVASLRRAFGRAGISEPEQLTRDQLRRALPELHVTLSIYHGDEEAEKRLAALSAICEEGQHRD